MLVEDGTIFHCSLLQLHVQVVPILTHQRLNARESGGESGGGEEEEGGEREKR